MVEIVFTGVFCLIVIMGVISLVWAKKGIGAISDELIKKLFKYGDYINHLEKEVDRILQL